MLQKARAALKLLEAGNRVSNPEAWKMGQVTVGAVSAFIGAAIIAFGVFTDAEISITEEQINGISAALIGLVPTVIGLYNIVVTVITTNKIGLLGKSGPKDQ